MRAEQMWGNIIHLWCKQTEFISWHWLLIFTNRKCSEMWNTVKHEMELSMEWSVERSDPWEPKLKIEKNRLIRLLPWKSCKLEKATLTSTYTLRIFLIHTTGSALVLLYMHSCEILSMTSSSSSSSWSSSSSTSSSCCRHLFPSEA